MISSIFVRGACFSCPQYGQSHIRQEAAWAASPCQRLRQTPGGSFPLTKKAALLGSLPQTREALQLVRRLRAPGEPDNSTEELLYTTRGGGVGGAEAAFYSDYLPCDLRLSTQRYFVPNGDRILELVVSTAAEWRVRCRGYWGI